MKEYYFLFAVALVWIIFAVFVDAKKREVPNWLNFSLIGFALAYRAFYSVFKSDWKFFMFGVFGFAFFWILAQGLYYARAFGGGDAKLLMGIGAILPFDGFYSVVFGAIGFLFVLFLAGTVYSFVYSLFLAFAKGQKFVDEFSSQIGERKISLLISGVIGAVFGVWTASLYLGLGVFALFVGIYFLYIYLLSVDRCMVVLKSPNKLTEGDLLEGVISVRGKIIKKSVHGLSWREIDLLKKAKKNVMIKEGIPFTPAFLISWIFMVLFYLVLKLDFLQIFLFLS